MTLAKRAPHVKYRLLQSRRRTSLLSQFDVVCWNAHILVHKSTFIPECMRCLQLGSNRVCTRAHQCWGPYEPCVGKRRPFRNPCTRARFNLATPLAVSDANCAVLPSAVVSFNAGYRWQSSENLQVLSTCVFGHPLLVLTWSPWWIQTFWNGEGGQCIRPVVILTQMRIMNYARFIRERRWICWKIIRSFGGGALSCNPSSLESATAWSQGRYNGDI